MESQFNVAQAVHVAARRAKTVLALLLLCLVADLAGLATGWWQLDLLERVRDGFEVSEERAALNDSVYSGVGLVQSGLFVVTGILWFRWLHPSYRNLAVGVDSTTRFTPGWAVGYWFVPIVNLVRPYQIMSELWSGSRDRAQGENRAPVPHVVGLWWAVWLLSGMVGRLFMRSSLRADELGQFIASTRAGMLNDGVTVLAAVLAIVMVRDIRRWQGRWVDRPAYEPTTVS